MRQNQADKIIRKSAREAGRFEAKTHDQLFDQFNNEIDDCGCSEFERRIVFAKFILHFNNKECAEFAKSKSKNPKNAVDKVLERERARSYKNALLAEALYGEGVPVRVYRNRLLKLAEVASNPDHKHFTVSGAAAVYKLLMQIDGHLDQRSGSGSIQVVVNTGVDRAGVTIEGVKVGENE